MKLEEVNFLKFLKCIDQLNCEDLKQIVFDHIKGKLTSKNILIFLKIANSFNMSRLETATLSSIDRLFTIVSATKNFLELDFSLVAKILPSSRLHVTSELEVFNAADAWIGHSLGERSRHAEKLMLKTRFPLLSRHALKLALQRKTSSFRANDECLSTINKILEEEEGFFRDSSRRNFAVRYCEQTMFNVLVYGGESDSGWNNDVYELKGKNFEKCKHLNKLPIRPYAKAAVVKDAVYFFGGSICTVGKYSLTSGKFENLEVDGDRFGVCRHVCALMDKVYIIGGPRKKSKVAHFSEFDADARTLKRVAGMNEFRRSLSCAVFRGKVVVCGGNRGMQFLNTVEAYDAALDEWTYMPSMVERRNGHASVAVRDKLFVVCWWSFEVFDHASNKFTLIRSNKHTLRGVTNQMFSIGGKLGVLQLHENVGGFFLYDVETKRWSEERLELPKDIRNFRCIKIPQLHNVF